MAKSKSHPPVFREDHHSREFIKVFRDLCHRNSPGQVFGDFIEMAACAISNAVDAHHRADRETRYLTLINSYHELADRQLFPQLLAHVTCALERHGPHDVFGEIWAMLLREKIDLGNKWKGQYFTPFHVSHMMAKMALHDCGSIIEEKGFITAEEPACGPGGMVAAMALALQEDGHNYQQCLHVTATDIDLRCAHMTYIAASLMAIPAIVVHGNSLSLEEWSHWYTPQHVLGGWDRKLRNERRNAQTEAEALPDELPELPLAAE